MRPRHERAGDLHDGWITVGPHVVHDRCAPAWDAPPIVLVHGAATSRYWVRSLVPLSRYGSVHAIDLPGYGSSSRPAPRLDVHAQAEVVVGWLRAADAVGATVVGNSLGCTVAVLAAIADPVAVGRLVLEGPVPDRLRPSRVRHALSQAVDVALEPPPHWWRVAEGWVRSGPRAVLSDTWAGLAEPLERWLPEVGQPTLVVRGALDPICSSRWAAEVADAVVDGEVVTIPRSAHTPHASRPRTFAGVVGAFVGRHAAPAAR